MICQHCYCRQKILMQRDHDWRECCWCHDLKSYKEIKRADNGEEPTYYRGRFTVSGAFTPK